MSDQPREHRDHAGEDLDSLWQEETEIAQARRLKRGVAIFFAVFLFAEAPYVVDGLSQPAKARVSQTNGGTSPAAWHRPAGISPTP